MIYLIPIEPRGAPRQVRSDAWKPSLAVQRYRAYQVELLVKCLKLPEEGAFTHMVFILEMPHSWSAKKKINQEGMPHRSKPDRDNLEKAILDTVHHDDAHCWNGATSKLWGRMGLLLISSDYIPFDGLTPVDLSPAYAWARCWRANDPPRPIDAVLGGLCSICG